MDLGQNILRLQGIAVYNLEIYQSSQKKKDRLNGLTGLEIIM